jgi:hypothetical protein
MSEEKQIDLSEILPNSDNPRFIKDEKFEKLVDNIKNYPNFLKLRPIVIESWFKPVILGGNMRYRALKELGYKTITREWVRTAQEFTEEEQKAFIILDNVGFGEWDSDLLANQWNESDLQKWGVDLPDFKDLGADDDNEGIKDDGKVSFIIEVVCKDEVHQQKIYNKLIEGGYECRILTL